MNGSYNILNDLKNREYYPITTIDSLEVTIQTSSKHYSGTDCAVYLVIDKEELEVIVNNDSDPFENSDINTGTINYQQSLAELRNAEIKLRLGPSRGKNPGWCVSNVKIEALKNNKKIFILNKYMSNKWLDPGKETILQPRKTTKFTYQAINSYKEYPYSKHIEELKRNYKQSGFFNAIYDKIKDNPSITQDAFQESWRIEPHVRNAGEDNINAALSLSIHDPLWIMTRQWQMGEYNGNDAGSAVLAKICTKKDKAQQLFNLNNNSDNRDTIADKPIEPLIEALPPNIDLQAKTESAYHFLNMARFKLNDNSLLRELQQYLAAKFPLTNKQIIINDDDDKITRLQKETAQLKEECKPDAVEYKAAFNQLFDGYQLYISEEPVWTDFKEGAFEEPLSQLQQDYAQWMSENYNLKPNDYWKKEEMNYRFGINFSDKEKSVLAAENYDTGKVSWYSFSKDKQSEEQNEQTKASKEKYFSFIPSMVSYGGMPSKRLWEMEENAVDLGTTIGVGVRHFSNALLLQFATMYSNDWMMLPLEMSMNSLTEVDDVIVTDVFGERTYISNRKDNSENQQFTNRWNMFGLSQKDPFLHNDFSIDNRLFYPPVVYNSLESEPIEEIQFLRDEMTNMVWAVENKIDQGCGTSISGKQFAAMLEDKLAEREDAQAEDDVNTDQSSAGGDYQYILQNTVPSNWIPLSPARIPGNIENNDREIAFIRSAMPLPIEGSYIRLRPNTSFLREGISDDDTFNKHLYINEEEVDMVGAKLIKTYQRTRWLNGKTYLWQGYKKELSKTQADSRLVFDKIIEKKEKNNL